MTVCAGGRTNRQIDLVSPSVVQSLGTFKLLGLSNIEEIAPRKLPYFLRSYYKLDLGSVVLIGKHGRCYYHPLSKVVQMT